MKSSCPRPRVCGGRCGGASIHPGKLRRNWRSSGCGSLGCIDGRPICGPLLVPFWSPLSIRVIYAVDAFLALAFAEGTLAAIAFAIALASAISGLAIAFACIFALALARLLMLSSAFASAVGHVMPFALAIRANLSTRLATHAGRGRAQSLRMATAKAIVALEWRPWS